jgi:hypothetical protein
VKDEILRMVRESAAREQPYGWLNYQPIDLPGYEETVPLRGRDCFDRARAIFPRLQQELGDAPLSICDWGSNLGFFVFEAAKLGHVACGYDSDPRQIEACKYLASSGAFRFTPSFQVKRLSADAVRASPRCDVILCFSVLHHLKEPESSRAIDGIAGHCNAACLELDGANYGRNALETFFWRVLPVVETNDRYGNGRRRRRTWLCTNRDGDRSFHNIKQRDFVHDRAVFACARASGPRTVLKRERISAAPHRHTWLRTGLAHEREIYERYSSPFFPKLLASGEDEFRWIEIEHIETRGAVPPEAIDTLYDFLEASGLFIMDFKTDSFIACNGQVKMVDLESVFLVEGSIRETLARHLSNPARPAPGWDSHDTYEKQRRALKRALCR